MEVAGGRGYVSLVSVSEEYRILRGDTSPGHWRVSNETNEGYESDETVDGPDEDGAPETRTPRETHHVSGASAGVPTKEVTSLQQDRLSVRASREPRPQPRD